MNLLSNIYTDEIRVAIAKHNNESWTRVLSDISIDVDTQFLTQSHTLDKEQLHVVNQQRVALQQLLELLITSKD